MKVPAHITEQYLKEMADLVDTRKTEIEPVNVYDVDGELYCLFHDGQICHESDYDEKVDEYEYEHREDGCPHCGDVGCQWCSGVDYLM